jgi:hypothetical protein
MRLGLLGCAAALTLIGSAAAKAETIYVEPGYAEPSYVEPGYVAAPYVAPSGFVTTPSGYVGVPSDYVAAPSGYVYTQPAPIIERRYMITEPAPVIVTEPAPTVIAEPALPVEVAPPVATVSRPLAVTRRDHFVERRVVPRRSGIVTTGYSASHRCFIDRNGFERCY